MKVEILGPGCAKCHRTEGLVRETLGKLGIEAEVVHITKIEEIVDRGVMLTPAVIIDGVKKIEGRIPSKSELEEWFRQ
jgi:small redox-active disulfide protein 2